MYYKGWNDHELLYLIREGNYKALNLMYLKYEKFIRIKARDCGFKAQELEDCVQEGFIMLNDAIKRFNPDYNKSFTKYFELILVRRFWRIRSNQIKRQSYIIDNTNLVSEKNYLYENIQLYKTMLDEEQAYIFEQIYYYRLSVKDLALKMNVKLHYIYKNLRKIREKLALEFDL